MVARQGDVLGTGCAYGVKQERLGEAERVSGVRWSEFRPVALDPDDDDVVRPGNGSVTTPSTAWRTLALRDAWGCPTVMTPEAAGGLPSGLRASG
ncbi:hypothetical protein [Cellulomonas sp. ATA003]|uniref:hypothetical protein n=1 Tax=Cellulomonas sp. ATA003 TaxID=3073064 RepID=UPI002872D7C5|nr:hypothetical protein [Cellulomonas sp. ATA003]WNB85765.1 hypothetical protein REH70_20110 [Cellulomonas sp. ATA003]